MQNIQLAATDLDGTLFYDRENITEADRTALMRLRARGILCCAATGREMRAVVPAFDRLGLWPLFDYVIHTGGGGIYDIADGVDETRGLVPPEHFRALIHRYENEDIALGLPIDGRYYTNRRSEILARDSGILGFALEVTDDLASHVTHPHNKIVMAGSKEQIDKILPLALRDPDPMICWHRSHENYIDCYRNGTDKGEALAALCDRLGIPLSETMAIGDNENDLQLLAAAGVSACPADGTARAKEAADIVTCAAAQGAFADLCNRVVFAAN